VLQNILKNGRYKPILIRYTNYIKVIFVALLRTAFAHASTPEEYRYTEDETSPDSKLRIYRAIPQRMFKPPAIVVNVEPGNAQLRYFDDEKVSSIYRVHDQLVSGDQISIVPVYRLIEMKDSNGVIYTEDTHFTLNKTTGVITWIVTAPATYYATYDTFKFTDKYVTVEQAKHVQSMLNVPVTMTVYALRTTDRERLTDLVILYTRHLFRDLFKPILTYSDIKLGGEVQTDWENQPLFSNTVTVDCWSQYANEIDYGLYDLIQNIDINIAVKNVGE
jgi:hypothetical protein